MNDGFRVALDRVRLNGALFFRSELTEPFQFESTPLALADALVPGADRLTLFHIVAAGSCWIAVDDGVRYWGRGRRRDRPALRRSARHWRRQRSRVRLHPDAP